MGIQSDSDDLKLKNTRITIFFSLLLMVSFLALGGRCFYLQYYRNKHYSDACIGLQKK